MITEIEVRMKYHKDTGKYPINKTKDEPFADSLRGKLVPDIVEDIMPYLEWLEEQYIQLINKHYDL